MSGRVLVAGIGNIFLGDDGFGSEVVRRLRADPGPDVCVRDYGIRGMHLAYDLLDGWDALVLVDALPRRGTPGTIEILRAEPGASRTDSGSNSDSGGRAGGLDAHAMDPEAVFAAVRTLGGVVPPTVIVGCRVETVAEGIGLSGPVAAAVTPAVAAIETVLADLLDRQEV
ncbi:hydrogenase maturation protease [Nocardia sp. GAS34]|uniref:hydrogenase maturation protease n=1 Tax=unclassified Nocardia TaxID=2637762 RepID=UPI003D21C24D